MNPSKIFDLLKRAHGADILFSHHVTSGLNDPYFTPDMSGLPAALDDLRAGEEETHLETLLQDLGVDDVCAGFITDGDMSVKWPTLFENWIRGEIKKDLSVGPLIPAECRLT